MSVLVSLAALSVTPLPAGSAGVQSWAPRRAIVRDARPNRPVHCAPPEQTGKLRAEAMEQFGLNLNDYWMLKSGSIAECIPTQRPSAATAARRERIQREADEADKRRLRAEQRLAERVRSPACAACGSNAQAAARLCAALHEARRLHARMPQLVQQAEALLAVLERAAGDDYERQQRELAAARSGEDEARRREQLLLRLMSSSSAEAC